MTEDATPRLERQTYLDERKSLIVAEHDQSRLFDTTVITLASGALGLSLTFIRQIAPTYDKSTVSALYLGWFAFIASVLSTLASYRASQSALRRQRDILDQMHAASVDVPQSPANCAAILTSVLNWASLVFFILGTVMLTVFVILNY
jgi:hypothetical protein